MGCDWRLLTYWEYGCRMVKWNEAHPDPNAPKPIADVERMKKIMAVH